MYTSMNGLYNAQNALFGSAPQYSGSGDIFKGIYENFKNRFYDVKHSDIYWKQVMPIGSIDSTINPGANSMSYPVTDWKGVGAFRAKFGGNIPNVSLTYGKNIVPIETAGIAANMDTDEIRMIEYGQRLDLRTRLPETMRKAVDLHNELAFFYGDLDVNFLPFLDYPGVTVTNAAATGTASATEWEDKTADQILADINSAMTSLWTTSKGVHTPNCICLPPSKYGLLVSTPRSEHSDTTILEFLSKNNIYTNRTGGKLEIITLPYLEDAGVSGAARMVVFEKKVENMIMPYSILPTFLEPQRSGFTINLFAEYKFGSVHIPYPMAYMYVDGI